MKKGLIITWVIICIVVLVGVLGACSPEDAVEEPVFIKQLYVYDPVSGDYALVSGSEFNSWTQTTTNNVPVEMWYNGIVGHRYEISPQSALSFSINIVARDDVANDVARYFFNGLIKRDNANNTTLSYINGAAEYEDDAAWNCVVAADDVNEALVITVTGDVANTVNWEATLSGVEVHF
jgi:hypothetical protein